MENGHANRQVVLLAPNSVLRQHLEAHFDVLSWPACEIQPPQSFSELDEAIENLYGYDWIIFTNPDSVRFFLERFTHRMREVSDLDSLSVAAISETTATLLEQAAIHVDIVATRTDPSAVIEHLATYTGADSLDRLNFLLPQAAIGRDYLKSRLADEGARVDVVRAYQTVATDDQTRLASLQTVLLTGSVDALAFASPDEVIEMARVFDTPSLGGLAGNAPVFVVGSDTTRAALAADLRQAIELPEPVADTIASVIVQNLEQ